MKKTALFIFLIVVIAQWAVPLSMIRTKEDAIKNGRVFCFKTAPIDPTDYFSGKYIALNFDASNYEIKESEKSIPGQEAFAIIKEDKDGFAMIESMSATEPAATPDYVKIKFRDYYYDEKIQHSRFDFPFDRLFMEEEKAPRAEKLYRASSRDTSEVTCAVVHIWKGEGVVTDVTVNGKSIVDIIKEEREK
jgi:uncharacterized membrane-anchored protein